MLGNSHHHSFANKKAKQLIRTPYNLTNYASTVILGKQYYSEMIIMLLKFGQKLDFLADSFDFKTTCLFIKDLITTFEKLGMTLIITNKLTNLQKCKTKPSYY